MQYALTACTEYTKTDTTTTRLVTCHQETLPDWLPTTGKYPQTGDLPPGNTTSLVTSQQETLPEWVVSVSPHYISALLLI